jgi:hypothetical protein
MKKENERYSGKHYKNIKKNYTIIEGERARDRELSKTSACILFSAHIGTHGSLAREGSSEREEEELKSFPSKAAVKKILFNPRTHAHLHMCIINME